MTRHYARQLSRVGKRDETPRGDELSRQARAEPAANLETAATAETAAPEVTTAKATDQQNRARGHRNVSTGPAVAYYRDWVPTRRGLGGDVLRYGHVLAGGYLRSATPLGRWRPHCSRRCGDGGDASFVNPPGGTGAVTPRRRPSGTRFRDWRAFRRVMCPARSPPSRRRHCRQRSIPSVFPWPASPSAPCCPPGRIRPPPRPCSPRSTTWRRTEPSPSSTAWSHRSGWPT